MVNFLVNHNGICPQSPKSNCRHLCTRPHLSLPWGLPTQGCGNHGSRCAIHHRHRPPRPVRRSSLSAQPYLYNAGAHHAHYSLLTVRFTAPAVGCSSLLTTLHYWVLLTTGGCSSLLGAGVSLECNNCVSWGSNYYSLDAIHSFTTRYRVIHYSILAIEYSLVNTHYSESNYSLV